MNSLGIDIDLTKLTELEGLPLLAVLVFMVGFTLKKVPKYPDDLIPVAVIFAGTFLSPFMVGVKSAGEMNGAFAYPFPEVAAWCQACARGFVCGGFVAMSHKLVLKRIEKWIAGKFGTELPPPGTMSQAEKTAIDASAAAGT